MDAERSAQKAEAGIETGFTSQMGNNGVCARLAAMVLVLASGCATLGLPVRVEGRPALEHDSLGDMTNVRRCGDTWLGAAPDPDDLELAIRRGVTFVLDVSDGSSRYLRGGGADPSVICARAGVEYRHIAFDSVRPSEAAVDGALTAIRQAGGRTALLYCRSGNNVGLLFAIWRAIDHGMDVEVALAEGRRVGMKPGAQEHAVRAHVARLRARMLAQRAGIRTSASLRSG